MLAVATVVFVFVMVVLYRGLTRRDDHPVPRWASGNRLIVGAGIVLPTVVIVPLMILTLVSMNSLASSEPDAVRVRVVGHQFWWEVVYPDLGIVTANEIHLPVGRDVEIELVSDNVIHAFWAPALGHKLDTTPGRTNYLVWRANEAGTYQGYCAEYCGVQHAGMRFRAVALDADEFEQWVDDRRAALDRRAADADDGSRGLQLFVDGGCGLCHTIAGTTADGVAGPDLTHIGIRQTLGAGIVDNESDVMQRWIAAPADLKPGVLMPAFDDRLSAEEIEAIARYLDGLD